MDDFVQNLKDRVTYDTTSVHYNLRRFDGMYEIVARAEVDGVWRHVALDIRPSRTAALKVVRALRGHEDAA